VVHIRHEYTPVLGNSNTIGDPAHYDPRDPNLEEFASLCPSASLLQALTKMGNSDEYPVGLAYVDFIVTTANTWKTPIEDFTLIVERPATSRSKANFVSFCWDGPVTKLDDRHFSAHLTNSPSPAQTPPPVHPPAPRSAARESPAAHPNGRLPPPCAWDRRARQVPLHWRSTSASWP